VIGLRPDHHVDRRLPAHDLLALGLRHAPGDRDTHHTAARLLDVLQPAEFGEDFLRRFLTDVAGVEHDEISRLGRVHRRIAKRLQHVPHPFGIVDVGLTAIGLDVEAFCIGLLRRVAHADYFFSSSVSGTP